MALYILLILAGIFVTCYGFVIATDIDGGSTFLGIVGMMAGISMVLSPLVIADLNNPDQGVVIGKEFVKKHLVCSKGCYRVPDKWYLDLDDHGNKGPHRVSEKVFNEYEKGEYYGR